MDVVVQVPPVASSSPDFDQCRALIRRKHFREAIDGLQQLVDADPELVEARALLAKTCETVGDRRTADTHWSALAGHSDARVHRKFRPLVRMAKVATQENNTVGCVDFLERHLALVPSDAEASEKLLETKLTPAPLQERRTIYDLHVERYSEPDEVRLLLATHIVRFSSPEEASAIISAVCPRLMKGSQGIVRLARAYEVVGDWPKALDVLDQADPSKPGDIKLAKMRLRILQQSGGSRDAIVGVLDVITAVEPKNASHWALRGRLLTRFRDWSGAADAYENALALDDQVPTFWEGAIAAYNQIEREDRADDLLAKAEAAFRDKGPEGHVSLARIQIAGGLFSEAEDNARAALDDPEIGLQAQAILAEAIMSAGNYRRGWDHAGAVLRSGGDSGFRRLAARCSSAIRLAQSDEDYPGALFMRAILDPPRSDRFDLEGPILLVSSSLGTGGAERQIALTSNLLARARGGNTVLVGLNLDAASGRAVMRPLAETPELAIEDLGGDDDARLLRSSIAQDPGTREAVRLIASFPRRAVRDIARLYACFRRNRPSLVHLWQDGVIATGSVAAVLAGVPRIVASVRNVVAGENDRGRYKAYLAPMYRALAQRPDVAFTANAEAGARDYEAMMGVERGRIMVVRNGIDAGAIRGRANPAQVSDIRQQLGVGDNDIVIGGVFRLTPPKRPLLWLTIAAKVADQLPRARFLHCGDGPLRDEVAAAADRLGLSERITLAGRKSPVEPWMAAMDAMVLASEVEGLPNVLLEAQALGVPVIATEAGGSAEAMLDGVTGRIVAGEDPDSVASAVVALVNDRGLRVRTRIGGPAFIEQRFGLDRMIRDTLRAYESLSSPANRSMQ